MRAEGVRSVAALTGIRALRGSAITAAIAATASCPAPSALESLSFTSLGPETGITLLNVSGSRDKPFILESIGQGGAALDYDGDGWLDLFVANGGVTGLEGSRSSIRPALYRNLGGLRFTDVTSEAGLLFEGWAHGAWRVDFDGDGWPDLYVTISDGPNRFFRNVHGRFEDATAQWGGADEGASTAACFFDADADGDLDLYVGNYVSLNPRAPPNGGRPCEWHGLQVFCGPQGLAPASDTFWENRAGVLQEASAAFGFAGVPPSYALSAVAADFDGDGDPDLYVANDSMANYYFENLGGGHFRETGAAYKVDRNQDGRAQASMGLATGDMDADGRLDLFVTNFSHDSDTLYRNSSATGSPSFEDVTFAAGLGLVTYSFLSWGTEMLDLDRDGWLDLVVVSGHVYPQVDGAATGTSYAQRNQVYRNLRPDGTGRVRFEIYDPPPTDAFARAAVGRGLVTADLDEDGDADFLVVTLDSTPALVRNDSRASGHWIGLSLRGAAANTEAVGTRLWIEDSAGRVQLRERAAGGGYLSSSDPRILVGLGNAGGPVKVTLRWPGGRTSVHEGLEPDRYHSLRE